MAVGVSPAQVGQTVQLSGVVWTAIVSPHQITGTISFTMNGAAIPGCVAVPLVQLVARCETAFQRAGTYEIGGAYSGDAWWAASSDTAKLAISKAEPGVYLAFAPEAPTFADKVTLGALVLGATGVAAPSGTVTFSEGGTKLGSLPVDPDGHARLALTLGAGLHSITATYSGDDNYVGGFAGERVVTVTKAVPIVAISSTPAQINQPVTFTASVTALTAGGAVSFTPMSGCSGLPLLDGKATCRTSFAQMGDVTVTATYSGDANLLPGSATLKLKVGRVVAGVFVAFAPAAPVFGETVRVSALATGATGVAGPTGAILFYDSGVSISGAVLDVDGRAAITAALRVGAHPITAVYNGDVNYGSSQAAATLLVSKAGTTTTVTAATGAPFTAIVAPLAPGSGTPTGAVRFVRDGQSIGTVALVAMGTASSATLAASTQVGNVTAEYAGDGNFNGSVSSPVVVAPSRVQVTLTSNANPVAEGQASTFTATVTPNPGSTSPTGNVLFAADGATLGSVNITAGRASLTLTMSAGSHAVTAAYSGDATYPGASAGFVQVVSAPAASVTLTAVERDAVAGQPITFVAQVTGTGTGRVQFTDGGSTLGAASPVSGVARLTISTLAVGTHAIGATWGAASAELPMVVNRARTTTALAWSGAAAVATIAVAAPGAGSPAGTVRFLNAINNSTVAVATLIEGSASIPWTMGEPLVAVYGGDDNFLASVSAAVSPLAAANAASYVSQSFAPDEIVTLFGRNLGGIAAPEVTDSAAAVQKVEVLYAVQDQAAIVMPGNVAPGPAVLRVGGMWLAITITRTAPGIFTADSSGTGAPAGVVDEIDVDTGFLVLYGTGMRHGTVRCTVGGRAAEVLYAGAQGGFAGLDQVNVALPAELRGSGVGRVVLTVDGVAANAVTVRIR